VLEINPLPGLVAGFSDVPRVADAGGVSFTELVNLILDHALVRHGLERLRKQIPVAQSRTAD